MKVAELVELLQRSTDHPDRANVSVDLPVGFLGIVGVQEMEDSLGIVLVLEECPIPVCGQIHNV